jgi:hypothetical protein
VAIELRNTRKVKLLAQTLRGEVSRLGVDLPPGDSAQRLVASKVEEIAGQLGVTTRTVLDSYLTDDTVRTMAKAVARQMKGLTAALDETPAIMISTGDGLMLLAAFGVCGSLALRNLEHPNAMIVLKDATDSTFHIAVSLAESDAQETEIGGLGLSVARKVLAMVVGSLREQVWGCGCAPTHARTDDCELLLRLAADLAALH